MESIKTRENKVKRQLARQGYSLQKSRTGGCVYQRGVFQGLDADDHGGYRIIDTNTGVVEAGERFDLSLEDVEQWAAE